MSFSVLIPARYDSTRLPGKVLSDIGGRPMLQWVFERAQASGARAVVIATDDERVVAAARAFGADVRLTGAGHRSGTERIAEVIEHDRLDPDHIVVNLQADEPFMPASLIRGVAEDLARTPDCSVATLCEPITDPTRLFDTNAVKVVTDRQGFALYFSRATIPWYRDAFAHSEDRAPQPLHFRHIGIYAYRAGYLRRYVRLTPSPLELAESLEQLRVLYAGDRIHVACVTESPGPGVDTPADLERARALAAHRPG